VSASTDRFAEYNERKAPTLGVRLRPDALEALRQRAEAEGLTPAKYVRRLLRDDLGIDLDIESPSS
jgi:predicted DNA binding CopG/RHH family protein